MHENNSAFFKENRYQILPKIASVLGALAFPGIHTIDYSYCIYSIDNNRKFLEFSLECLAELGVLSDVQNEIDNSSECVTCSAHTDAKLNKVSIFQPRKDIEDSDVETWCDVVGQFVVFKLQTILEDEIMKLFFHYMALPKDLDSEA